MELADTNTSIALAPVCFILPHRSYVTVIVLLPSQQAPAAKKDQKKVKAAKKLPDIPGLDSSLFKQAMAEQKSHGLMMKGAKIGRSVSLFKIHNHARTGKLEEQVSVCTIVSDCVRDLQLED